MASVLIFGSKGPVSSSGQTHCVVFLGEALTLSVPPSTQVYKRVSAKFMLAGNTAID